MYAVLFSDAFDGHLYEDVARRFFTGYAASSLLARTQTQLETRRFEVTLLAVYRREKDQDHPRVMLSPFGKVMRAG